MLTNVTVPSFASGELAPSLYGRVDLAKYHTAAALLRNMIVDYRGGAMNRPGTMFVGRAKADSKPVRLIPFEFSTTPSNIQTYMLAFGDMYVRFMQNGGYITEAAKNITGATQANPCVITSNAHGFSNGDEVAISGVGGMTQLNGRNFLVAGVTANTFQLQDLDGNNIDSTGYGAYTSGGTASRIYTVATPYAAADLALLKYTQSADTMTLTHTAYATYDLTRTGNTAWTLTQTTFAPAISAPTGLSIAVSAAGSTVIKYVVTAVNDYTGEESRGSAIASGAGSLDAGAVGTYTPSWNAVTGATSYRVYRAPVVLNGTPPDTSLFGLVTTISAPPPGTAPSYIDSYPANASAFLIPSDFSKTPPQARNPFNSGPLVSPATVTAGGSGYGTPPTVTISDPTGLGATATATVGAGAVTGVTISPLGNNYSNPTLSFSGGGGSGAAATVAINPTNFPGCVTYFQQRRWFAGSASYPSTMWMTRIGLIKNMDVAVPTLANDAITISLASVQVNAIQHLVPMTFGVVTLTASGVWHITGGSPGTPITPTQILAQPQAYNGVATNPAPIVINYNILFVQPHGNRVRDLSYNFYVNIYTGEDASMLAEHLFGAHTITEWGFAEEPNKAVWAVRDDGMGLALTYLKEQQVNAWTRHDTQGYFQSVAVIQEGTEDIAYFVVKRFIGGKWVQYIERMASRNFAGDVTLGWFLDCALQNTFTYPNATLSFLSVDGVTDLGIAKCYDGLDEIHTQSTIVFTASSAVFSSGNVGNTIRVNGGRFKITAFTSTTQVTAICKLAPYNFLPAAAHAWSSTAPVTVISGLNHLEGEPVIVLGDGNVFRNLTVSGGQITLPQACATVLVGLPYVSQVQTLAIEAQIQGQSIQGRRVQVAGAVIRFEASRGAKTGPTFSDLHEVKERNRFVIFGDPTPLTTGDEPVNFNPLIAPIGQVCIEQDYPLPMKVLAIMPSLSVGDT